MAASALDIAISVLENEVSRLEVSIDGLEKYLWISSVAVAIGVALELYFLIHEYQSDRKGWLRGAISSPSKPSIRMLSFEVASVLLVVAGVVGELWVGVVSGNRNTELRSKNSRLVGLVREKAGNAETAAGDAIERSGKLEKEAATLRLKLANSSIPRSLEEAAQERIAAKLPPRLTGGQVNVMYLPWTFDGLTLARQITGALSKAKIFNGPQIDVTSLEGSFPFEGGVPIGFASPILRVFTGVQVMHTSDPRSIAMASALASALTAEHIEEVRLLQGLTISPLAGEELKMKVTVRIGRKP
jgi:hypothetical protein